MPKIDQSVVETAPIPIPPLAEQEQIVTEMEQRLSVVEELEAMVSANFRRTDRLRQQILQRAFAGKLVSKEYHLALNVREEVPVAAGSPFIYGPSG
jgi:type I restriction enzyme, S subunit